MTFNLPSQSTSEMIFQVELRVSKLGVTKYVAFNGFSETYNDISNSFQEFYQKI